MKNSIFQAPLKQLARTAAVSSALIPWLVLAQTDKGAAPAKPEKSQTAKSSGSAKLPSAREVVDRFVKEIGGKEAFLTITSQHAKGKFEMAAQGVKGDLEVFAKRPNKLFVKVNIPGLGEVLSGYDGKVAWSLNPATGPMLLDGKQAEQARDQANFDSVLHDAKDYKSMESVEKTDFEGAECYKLKLVKKSGQEVTEFYDTKTGLLKGFVGSQESPFGAVVVTNALEDYKKFGGILFAAKITQKMGPVEQVMVVDSLELNKVEDSAFALPEQIQTLLKGDAKSDTK